MDLDSIEYIPSQHSSPSSGTPTLIVLHSMECPMEAGRARSVAQWFGGADSPQASAHYLVDPATTICGVRPPNIAWHVGNANWYSGGPSIGIEQTGYAAFSTEEWTSPLGLAQLDRVVDLVTSLCDRYGIPKTWLGPNELQAGQHGISTHGIATAAGIGTDHTDPGPNWPVNVFMQKLNGPTSPKEDEEMSIILVDPRNRTHWHVSGNTKVRLTHVDQINALKFLGAQVVDPAPQAWIDGLALLPRNDPYAKK